jgi:hypothetical protein
MAPRLAPLALLALAMAASACGSETRGDAPPPPARTTAAEDLGAAPVRGCRSRNETKAPIAGPGEGDAVLGPAYFEGVAELAAAQPSMFTPRGGRPYIEFKVLLALRAGTRATLVVPLGARKDAGIEWAKPAPPITGPFTVANGGAAVELRACAESTRAFSYAGTVGPWTQFGGGFIIAGAGCVPVELRVAGRREPYRTRLSFGAGDCG